MSLAILNQVYDETRRLAVAGSAAAVGDFRLKKLVAPLEQAGAKAPVFARIGQAVQTLVDAKEQDSADALLELATLISAVLYTQGETGAAGTLEPIETIELALPPTQTSARTLKPLFEALTATGAGRLELIRDAYERGLFLDIHLVQPALHALDDAYGEVADFVAEKALPLYGKAIAPDLRTKYDPKGKAGDARRLRLLHALDPDGARDLVSGALEDGSKDVKVAAISCLGGRPDDLRFLLEQTTAKAQEVRRAAYGALAALDDADAIAALEKTLTGKDLDLAAAALAASRSDRLVHSLIAAAEQDLVALPKIKDKKEASQRLTHLRTLAKTLAGRPGDAEAFLLKMFAQRDALAKVKGEPVSGADVNSAVIGLLQDGTPAQRKALAAAHAALPVEHLAAALHAARYALPAAEVFAMFSPYLTAKVDEKKKQRDPAWARREAVWRKLTGGHHQRYYRFYPQKDEEPPLDPRWLDVAVEIKHLDLVHALARSGHAALDRFLAETFETTLTKSKQLTDCFDLTATLLRVHHAGAADAFVAALEKHGAKAAVYEFNSFLYLVPQLPLSLRPRLEAIVPRLPERSADDLVRALQQLGAKT